MPTRTMAPHWRRAWRLARLAVHLAYGVVVATTAYPALPQRPRLALKRRWSRQLLSMLGVRLAADAHAIPPGSLIVANHVSWLDIFAINAVHPAAFVSKAEVRRWPLVGWLAARADTLFLERSSARHARHVKARMTELLRGGRHVAVYPEGTTGDGASLLPFRSALLQAAVDAGRPVQPLALSYHDADGRRSEAVRYDGDIGFGQSLLRIVAAPAIEIRLALPPPLEGGRDRRQLAQDAARAIRSRHPFADARG